MAAEVVQRRSCLPVQEAESNIEAVKLSAPGCKMQWGVVLCILSISPSLLAEQKLYHAAVPLEGGQMQWGLAICKKCVLGLITLEAEQKHRSCACAACVRLEGMQDQQTHQKFPSLALLLLTRDTIRHPDGHELPRSAVCLRAVYPELLCQHLFELGAGPAQSAMLS